MSEAAKPDGTPPHDEPAHDPHGEQVEHERVRALILARRNMFMAAALAGLGMGVGGCKGSTCLSPVQPPAKDGGKEDDGGGSGDPFGTAGPDGGVRLDPRDAAVLNPFRDADARVCLTIE